ncbi:MAG: epoxyqueuosine reductase QueH [Anaeroplasmataceae bacterium]
MINNYKDFKKYISSLDRKPRLLLHSCCAPCSSHTLLTLHNYFDIDIYYSNDNIYPKEEFYKRLDEQKRLCSIIDANIKVIDDGYKDTDYYDRIKGYEALGEHSRRCYECYYLRLEKTAIKAKQEGYEFFTTTLSISPYKNSTWINEIGYLLEEKYDVKYLYSDFKKEEGYKESIRLSREYNLYRQDYCGCVFSLNESLEKKEGKK